MVVDAELLTPRRETFNQFFLKNAFYFIFALLSLSAVGLVYQTIDHRFFVLFFSWVIITVMYHYIKKYIKRISRKRFYFILVLSVLSAVILTYQTLEYFHELTCCGDSNPEIIRAFREYSTFLGIPISLFGLLQMGVTICFLAFLALAPLPNDVTITQSTYQRILRSAYYLLLVELLISSVIVVNFIYLELAVIKSLCLPCSFSQITIFGNTLVIYFWKPFGTT